MVTSLASGFCTTNRHPATPSSLASVIEIRQLSSFISSNGDQYASGLLVMCSWSSTHADMHASSQFMRARGADATFIASLREMNILSAMAHPIEMRCRSIVWSQ